MKKWILVGILFIGIGWLSHAEPTKARTLVTYNNTKNYIIKELNTKQLTTKNIAIYTNQVKVLEVTIELSKIYQTKWGNLKTYQFTSYVPLEQNIRELETKMIQLYKNNALLKQGEAIYFHGLPITKIKVYGLEQEIANIEQKLKNTN